MGQRNDKPRPNDPAVTPSGEVEDISRKVTESQEDIDEEQYRIVITCRNNNRISKKDPVTTEISGDECRHLSVIINNKKYFNSLLPKAATACDYKIEQKKGADLLYLMITKSEPGFWMGKKR